MAKKQQKKHRKINKQKPKQKQAGVRKSKKHNEKEQQLEHIMAWGKSKQNYYQQEQNEYSQVSQEQDEARQIYDNQYEDENLNLNQEQFYQLPESQEQHQEDEEEQQQAQKQTINQQYIRKQILWATELAKMLEGVQDDKYKFRKRVYDSYLLILMSLKEFKIPYVSQHPLVAYLPQLKKALQGIQKQIPTLYEGIYGKDQQNQNQIYNQNQNQQEQEEQKGEEDSQIYDSQMQNQQQEKDSQQKYERTTKNSIKNKGNSQGMQIYDKILKQKKQQKLNKKQQNKQKRQQNLQKQAFRLVSENEGRLANEKILKNKGLMKRRRRGDGNSRLKLRYKYQKALVRRRAKGFVGVKENPGRFYQGQNKVLYGKIASTKLK